MKERKINVHLKATNGPTDDENLNINILIGFFSGSILIFFLFRIPFFLYVLYSFSFIHSFLIDLIQYKHRIFFVLFSSILEFSLESERVRELTIHFSLIEFRCCHCIFSSCLLFFLAIHGKLDDKIMSPTGCV